MENELNILNTIEKNQNATQRDIAKSTGMSLGSVNILIKRLAKKGLLKIERLSTRTIRYILTPHGLKEKAEATYNYVVASFKYINEIENKINNLIYSNVLEKSDIIYLYGNKDEILELLSLKLTQQKIKHQHISNIIDLRKQLSTVNCQLATGSAVNCQLSTILVCHPDHAEQLNQNNINYINLLEKI